MTTQPNVIEQTTDLTRSWLDELERDAHLRDQEQALSVLRAVLVPLRDRLTVDEAADLGAQLPIMLRGFYYESWRPATAPTKQRSKEEFLEAIAPRLNPSVEKEPEECARAVFMLLQRHVTDGEIEDVHEMLPDELRDLWPSHGRF